jgi:hypothetical protein
VSQREYERDEASGDAQSRNDSNHTRGSEGGQYSATITDCQQDQQRADHSAGPVEDDLPLVRCLDLANNQTAEAPQSARDQYEPVTQGGGQLTVEISTSAIHRPKSSTTLLKRWDSSLKGYTKVAGLEGYLWHRVGESHTIMMQVA